MKNLSQTFLKFIYSIIGLLFVAYIIYSLVYNGFSTGNIVISAVLFFEGLVYLLFGLGLLKINRYINISLIFSLCLILGWFLLWALSFLPSSGNSEGNGWAFIIYGGLFVMGCVALSFGYSIGGVVSAVKEKFKDKKII